MIPLAIQACAAMAQSVERILGKDEVTSSILVISSRKKPDFERNQAFLVLFRPFRFYGIFEGLSKGLRWVKYNAAAIYEKPPGICRTALFMCDPPLSSQHC